MDFLTRDNLHHHHLRSEERTRTGSRSRARATTGPGTQLFLVDLALQDPNPKRVRSNPNLSYPFSVPLSSRSTPRAAAAAAAALLFQNIHQLNCLTDFYLTRNRRSCPCSCFQSFPSHHRRGIRRGRSPCLVLQKPVRVRGIANVEGIAPASRWWNGRNVGHRQKSHSARANLRWKRMCCMRGTVGAHPSRRTHSSILLWSRLSRSMLLRIYQRV